MPSDEQDVPKALRRRGPIFLDLSKNVSTFAPSCTTLHGNIRVRHITRISPPISHNLLNSIAKKILSSYFFVKNFTLKKNIGIILVLMNNGPLY
jgi:hypothetical protein